MSKINSSPGGALAKTTSKPKDMHQEENKKFISGLNKRELQLKDIYEQIRISNDSSRLVQLVKDGIVSTSERDGLGMCPLLFAVDCSFSLDVLKSLKESGCDINTVDSSGDTLLHYALNLENKELEQWILSLPEGEALKTKLNNDGMTAYD